MTHKAFGRSAALGLFALVLGTAGVLFAQTGGGMGHRMAMMADCPMMRAMQESPAAALRQRDQLGLSPDQVRRLEALDRSAHQAHGEPVQRMRALHQEIARAAEGDRFDEAAARAAFGRMGEIHTEMGVAALRARHQVRQILTPEQRDRLSRRPGGMMGMHGMMMGRGIEHCPMMQGGAQHAPSGSHRR